MKKAAIFDVDGTIFRSSLVIELTEMLIERGIFPEKARKEYERDYRKWVEREGDYEAYIYSLAASFMKNIKGVHYGDFSDLAKEVVSEQRKHVYRYTRDLIKELKSKNFYLLAVSQSPKAILDSFCRSLGFNKVYGRIYELGPQDRFTGKIIDEHLIENKANIVRRAIEKDGLTLKDSIGVGDTEGDIPFLELVDKPICFNPNQKLYKQAKRLGWKVVVERKDVIYEI
ncbi:MAG: HAD-IB family hydrolase [Candidatus Pacebacteria bacterium]|jgi:HAD superfamily hydrolase (TIGR01490 family)|nr:HAD-IB family hydrolase [bacterium]MDP6527957.1 HAD-IB family hydrolase [Candidatus Paceibacterota bacterium]MDP6659486.1 HAD-IB family hydrolase [Candidatus Paceibacterota bacterium]|tara:strand:+ start:15978 stop:16661 length:684 start_codon:yes stop_codon:yes gene_type:complete